MNHVTLLSSIPHIVHSPQDSTNRSRLPRYGFKPKPFVAIVFLRVKV